MSKKGIVVGLLVLLLIILVIAAFGEIGGLIPGIDVPEKYDVECNVRLYNPTLQWIVPGLIPLELPGDTEIREITCLSRKSSSLFSILDWFIDKGVLVGEIEGKYSKVSWAAVEGYYADTRLNWERINPGTKLVTVTLHESPDSPAFTTKSVNIYVGG